MMQKFSLFAGLARPAYDKRNNASNKIHVGEKIRKTSRDMNRNIIKITLDGREQPEEVLPDETYGLGRRQRGKNRAGAGSGAPSGSSTSRGGDNTATH